MGRSYSQKTIKILFGESGNLCAFPKCSDVLIDDGVVVCDIAHIIPVSEKGPRGDSSEVTGSNRAENLLLLCLRHHKIIDDKPESYPVDLLKKYKEDHIAKIKKIGTAFELSDEVLSKASEQFNIKIGGDAIGSSIMALGGSGNQTNVNIFNILGVDSSSGLAAAKEYRETIISRGSELKKELAKVLVDEEALVSASRDPSTNDFVSRSFKSAILSDDPELYKIIAKAIETRIKNAEVGKARKDVAFAQVPELISSLTLNQLKLVAIHYVASGLSVSVSPSIEFVNTTIARIINPLGDVTYHRNDALQISGTVAATFMSLVEYKSFSNVRNNYDHLFIKPIPEKSVAESNISPEVITRFFRLTTEGYLLSQPLNSIEKYMAENPQLTGYENINQLYQMHKMTDAEVMEFLNSHAPALYRMVNINDNTELVNLSLSLPGKALALAVLEGYLGSSLDRIWVKDDDQKQFPINN
ncbi:MAG: HNH endonuclease signature motif containing protein [Candidatus Saccharimonadales bacterium]